MIEFMLAGDKVASGGGRAVARLLQGGQRGRVDPAVLNDLADECRIIFQVVGGSELRQIVGLLSGSVGWSIPRRRSASIDVIHQRLGNRVSVIAEIVFDVGSGVPDVVRPDSAAVLQKIGRASCRERV